MAAKSPRQAAQKTKDIRAAVQKELEFDPLVDTSDISVKNMSGDVALNGTVPAYPQYLQAAAAAKRVQGVTRVHNHLMVDLPFADYRDDALLTTDANNALAMSGSVPLGSVEGLRQRRYRLAHRVGGQPLPAGRSRACRGPLAAARGIADDIEIFSDLEAADVADLVQGALDRYMVLPFDNDVQVAASDGTVTLTGHIESWAEHDAVIDAAWRGMGVERPRRPGNHRLTGLMVPHHLCQAGDIAPTVRESGGPQLAAAGSSAAQAGGIPA